MRFKARAAGLERQQKERRAIGLTETGHQLVALAAAQAAMQPERIAAAAAGRVDRQPFAPARVWRKQQRLFAGLQNRVNQLLAAGQLAGAAGQIGAVGQVVGGVVADLLEPGQARQYKILAFDAIAGGGLLQQLIGHRLVQGGLLFAQLAEFDLLNFAR